MKAPLNEYAFDIKLNGAFRVRACTEADARRMLTECLDCCDANLGAWPNGDPILGEVSMDDTNPHLYEINGESCE